MTEKPSYEELERRVHELAKIESELEISREMLRVYGKATLGSEFHQTHCIFNDITDRKRAEDALIESEALFRGMFEDHSAVMLLIDPNTGQIIKANQAATVYYGYSLEKMLQMKIQQLNILSPAEVTKEMRSALDKQTNIFEFQHVLADGQVRDVEVHSTPITIQHQTLLFSIIRDITAHQEAEAKLAESEGIFRYIMESTLSGFWDWNLVDNTEYLSPTFKRMFGYEDHEMESSPEAWQKIIFPEDRPGVLEVFDRHVKSRGQEPFYNEIRYRHRDGSTVWVICVGRIIEWAEDGTAIRMVGCHVDITARKQAEAVLRESEERFRLIVDNSSDLIWILKLDGVFSYVAPSWELILGYEPSYMEGKAFQPFVHPEDVCAWEDYLREVIDGRKVTPGIQLRTKHADGSWRWLEATISPVYADEGSLVHFVGVSRDITEHKRAEHKLRDSEKKYRFMTEQMNDVVWTSDLEMRITYISPSDERILGFTPEERMEHTLFDMLAPFSQEQAMAVISKEYAIEAKGRTDSRRVVSIELEYRHKDGSTRLLETLATGIRDDEGRLIGLHGVSRDITGRKRAEEEQEKLQAQLRQAQKMESVGRLAGGVAHDFNNMLSVIIGNAELAIENMASNNPLHNNLDEILSAARRSADITRQLLAFARKQTIAPKVLDLNRTIKSMLKMLRRLIGEDIDLAWLPGKKVWPVKMDPAQIDQILANLFVNARDAITGVGKITIETGTATFDSAYCAEHPGFVAGDFVLLAVSDDGCGMDQETLTNLFEPFFTTKDADKGTGLGLATVYGVVKQNNGFINVYSEPDQGTTLKIYFPRHAAKAAVETKEPKSQAAERGSETILLVEDEPSILKMTRMMLERNGYKVLAAGTPGEAIRLANEHAGGIHLLMTDVVMPEMNGRDLARNLLSLYPNLKRLFMSGYTASAIAHHGVLDEGVQFIQKPFAKQDLAIKLREVLDEAR